MKLLCGFAKYSTQKFITKSTVYVNKLISLVHWISNAKSFKSDSHLSKKLCYFPD